MGIFFDLVWGSRFTPLDSSWLFYILYFDWQLLTIGLMNKIQFLTNLFNVILVFLIRLGFKISNLTINLSIISISINILCLCMFIFLFYYRSRQERRMSSLYIEKRNKDQIFEKLCKRVTINEGKFIFFFVWGANIDYTPGDQRHSNLNDSRNSEDLLDTSDIS